MTGVLLLDYILSEKKALNKMPENPMVVSTVVSTKLAKIIADYYGVEFIEVLTGFKYIAHEIKIHEGKKNFIFGFNE